MQIRLAKLFGLSVALVFFTLAAGDSTQIGLAQGGATVTVCASGCNFTTIQAAIDAASGGDTIQVQAGTYQENLTIRNKDGLTLKGAGQDQVTLDGNGPQQKDITPGILILNSRNITVTGFKVTNSRRSLEADDSTLLFIDANTFEKNLRAGIRLLRSQAEIKGNVVQGNQVDLDASNGQGIALNGSEATISDNAIMDNAECGVAAVLSDTQPSQVSGGNNTIENNKGGDLCGTVPTTLLAQPLPEGTLDQVAVPTDAVTIKEAVNKAKAGGTITVTAGTYKEQVQIYKSVTIHGAGPDQTVIQAPSIEYVAINIATDQLQVTLEGFKVTGGRRGVNVATGPAGNVTLRNVKIEANGAGRNVSNSDAGLWIFEQATATLDQVSIISNQGTGLGAFVHAKVMIQNSTITGNVGWGIYVSDTAQAQITNNQITASKPGPNANYGWGYGISIHQNAQVTLQGNTISQNSSYGIVLWNSSQVTIQKNTISNNKAVGVVLFESSKATLDDNTITGNVWAGIDLDDSSQATINNAHVTGTKKDSNGNGGWGIVVQGNSNGTIQNSTIQQSALYGTLVLDNAQATVQKSTISDNKSIGIYLVGSSRATIEDNTITRNLTHGIAVSDSSEATITNNRITGSAAYGIQVYKQSKSTIRNNTITDSGDQGIHVGATSIQNESLTTEISSNQIQNNKNCGVFADSDVGIKITGRSNTISGNTRLCGTTSKFPAGFGGGK